MKTEKPKIIFFARGYQAQFYPSLVSDSYDAVFVTLTRDERKQVENRGHEVFACFEDDLANLPPAPVPQNYLHTSFLADRFLGRLSHEARTDLLGREIAFWSRILDTFDPVAVVNEIVAIEISEVLYIETKKRGIRYLAPMRSLIGGNFYWIPEPISLSGLHLDPLEYGEEAAEAARGYLAGLKRRDFKPSYVKNLAGRLSPRPILAAFVKYLYAKLLESTRYNPAAFRYETYAEAYGKRLEVFFQGFFSRYDTIDDIPEGSEVILYPLHQEPEATLNYMSEFFANQVATIENILKSLSENQVLVVKEHPVDKGALLTRKFRELRSRTSALYFLPGEVSGRAIEPRLSRVVTLTSTVGWEMANLGKPVYVLGQIFFDSLPGIAKVHDFEELRNLLRTPLAKAPQLDLAATERFVASLIERSYAGDALPFSGLHSDENVERVKHAICDALELG